MASSTGMPTTNATSATAGPTWTWPTAVFLLVTVAFALIQHTYFGLQHDARIYLLLALHWLQPTHYANDILVVHGSQGDFTVFPMLAGQLIRWIGDPSLGLFVAWLGAYAVFVAGVFALSSALLPRPWHLLATGLVLVLPGAYGVEGVLSYGEAIATSRPAAEGFTLLALAWWLDARRLTALASLGVAMLFHPLMAMPGAVIIAFASLPRRVVWSAAALALAGTVALFAMSALAPSGLLAAMDPEWLAIVRARAPYLFPYHWTATDWGRALMPVSWLVLGLSVLRDEEPLGTLMRAALITALLGLVAAVFTDMMPSVVFVQGQPWRWVWTAKVIAIIVAPPVAVRLWNSGTAGHTTVMLASCAWVAQDFCGPLLAFAAALLWWRRDTGSPEFWRLMLGLSGASLLAGLCWSVLRTAVMARGVAPFVDEQIISTWIGSLTMDGVLSAIVVVLVWRWVYVTQAIGRALGVAVAATLVATLSVASWPRTITPQWTQDDYGRWQQEIPNDAIVYWPGHAPQTWLLLQRASYISEIQATASLFSRDTAEELARRATLANQLNVGKNILHWDDYPLAGYSFDESSVASLCEDGMLDFLVVPSSHDLADGLQKAISRNGLSTINGSSLLDCSDLPARVDE